ncbi:hypothetical protein WH50_12285 [Pokkaliibacter plantistimulans]|uniref:Uncharacterized protein n=1 Tax=Pokkaliibacter plantistimulans TaxID=1635171 RepID=A0ABX5LZE0_9GAMM|nr:hypothetical protein [Pokkaliibacter plantistimulans]PXF31010.1 hypothetical protein WH50_12285 [Pokkaliibacter plantistimulans]
MSQVWREVADPRKHRDYMSTRNEGGISIEVPKDNLLKQWVYFAHVCNFTFQFSSIEQVKMCREYFLKKTHPSTREIGHDLEHYWHFWFSKLPKGIKRKKQREMIVRALDVILANWS